MEETKKEEVQVKKENKHQAKHAEKVKLGPGATVLLTIVATLGIIVLIALIYAIFKVL